MDRVLKESLIETSQIVGFVVGAFLVLALIFNILLRTFGPTDEQIERYHAMQVIQEFDNCKVYRFWDGSFHYITRCGETVTTRKNYEESCGKACVKHKYEDLTTNGNKE
jgi:hypothetical protein